MKYSRCLIMAALLSLAACADPQIIYKPVPVNVPVAVPCKVTPIAKPHFMTADITKNSDYEEKTRALVVTEKTRQAYEIMLEAAVKSCQ